MTLSLSWEADPQPKGIRMKLAPSREEALRICVMPSSFITDDSMQLNLDTYIVTQTVPCQLIASKLYQINVPMSSGFP